MYGVSPDNAKKHQNFIAKYDLPFGYYAMKRNCWHKPLEFGVRKKMYGRTYMGVFRSSFVINAEGVISHVFANVKPKGHAQELLQALSSA